MDKFYKIASFKKIAAAAAALFAAFVLSALSACGAGRQSEEYGDGQTEEYMTIVLNTENGSCTVALEDTSAAQALAERLQSGDITFTLNDYGGFEKVGELGFSLPASDERITTAPGDMVLYQGDNIVIFYGSNTWEYTRIGSLLGVSGEQLRELLGAGQGSISVTLSLG